MTRLLPILGVAMLIGASGAPMAPRAAAAEPSGSGASAIRACEVRGTPSVRPSFPPEVLGAYPALPAPVLPMARPMHWAPWVSASQHRVLDGLTMVIDEVYVYPDALDESWRHAVEQVRARIRDGLHEQASMRTLRWLLGQLPDGHSYISTPSDLADERATATGGDYVGIGVMAIDVPGIVTGAPDVPIAQVVIAVVPDGPADRAGLRVRDVLLAVDDGPLYEADGRGRIAGLPETPVTLTVRSPGLGPREVSLTRGPVPSHFLVDACLMSQGRIGYLAIPTFYEPTTVTQIDAALLAMGEDGPLDGLILDLRSNPGGLYDIANPVLELFLDGPIGSWATRDGDWPMTLRGVDIGGSQTMPMVVLVGRDTTSAAEFVAGVLQHLGRATIIGAPTVGNVEMTGQLELPDGWGVTIAFATFTPAGGTSAMWEGVGVRPDILEPTPWFLVDEATDPAILAAVELLTQP